MSEMRQIANKRSTMPRQTTPNAPDEAQASPEVGIEYMTASPVCLPLMSESKKLVWVDSHQIDLQLDGAAELNKAFNRFPYLTDRQNAALAHHCSLHPDQVKVWFMTHRLRYGISWDYNDIRDMWRKFEFSQGEAEITNELHQKMQEGFIKERGNNKRDEEKITEWGEKKTGEEPSARKKQTGTTNTQVKTNTKQKQPMKQEKNKEVEGDRISTLRKRKRVAVMGQRKKRKEGITERADKVEDESEKGGHCEEKCTLDGALCTKKKEKSKEKLNITQESLLMSPFLLDIPLDINSLFIIKPETQTLNSITQNDDQTVLRDRLDGLLDTPNIPMVPINSSCEGRTGWDTGLGEDPQANLVITDMNNLIDNGVAANDPPILTQMQDHYALALRSSCNLKTPAQLNMLKMAFLDCQYPDSEYYRHLEELTGVSRQGLIQWFADMRYSIKKSKPRWMSEEQHKHTLFSVMYHQYKKVLSRKHQTTNDDSTTMMIFEGSRSHEEGDCVNK